MKKQFKSDFKIKKLISLSLLLVAFSRSYAQEYKVRAEINRLEQKSRQAILEKDSATLHKLWSPTFMVNAPSNTVIIGKQVDMVMNGQISYTSYKGKMEEMLVSGDIVITMGHEIVVPTTGNNHAAQPINRRYTNIWKKQRTGWILIARQASEIYHL